MKPDLVNNILFGIFIIATIIAMFSVIRGRSATEDNYLNTITDLTHQVIERNNKLMGIEIVLVRMLDKATPEVEKNIRIMIEIIRADLLKEEATGDKKA